MALNKDIIESSYLGFKSQWCVNYAAHVFMLLYKQSLIFKMKEFIFKERRNFIGSEVFWDSLNREGTCPFPENTD